MVPSVAAPPPSQSGARLAIRIVVGGLIVVIGAVALLNVFTSANMEEATDTYPGIAALDLDLRNGPVIVVAGETDEVVVEKSYTTGFLGGSTEAEVDGDTLRLIQRCPAIFGFGCRSSYRVSVPAATTVTGRTSNGAITIDGLDGAIDVATSNGAVDLERLTSTVAARTSNGAVSGTGLLSSDLDVSTSNGRVSLEFAQAPSSVRVTTSNGEIDVTLPEDSPPYAVSTSTSNGRVSNEIRTDPAAGETIDLRTSNGDISLRYPG
jgi:hypothetical protein